MFFRREGVGPVVACVVESGFHSAQDTCVRLGDLPMEEEAVEHLNLEPGDVVRRLADSSTLSTCTSGRPVEEPGCVTDWRRWPKT